MRYFGKRWRGLYTSPFSCVHLVDIPEPELVTPEWVKVKTRLSGICGSDLATITAKGSPYFSPFTSTPFVLGHEIVGEIVEIGNAVEGFPVGARVVIEPALSCKVRGISPPCYQCQDLHFANCENITKATSLKAFRRVTVGIQAAGGADMCSRTNHNFILSRMMFRTKLLCYSNPSPARYTAF